MRHIFRAALVVAFATSSAALAGSGSEQASGESGTSYEKLNDGYRESVSKSKDGVEVKVTVEQKNWRSWAEARNRELRKAKADAFAAQERAAALEAQLAELAGQQQQQQLSGVGEVKQDERGLILTLTGGVLFTSGSSELMPNAKERLDTLAEVLKQAPDARFTIEGHTDSQGSDEFNQDLSERRAQSVKDYLVEKGISGESIQTVGHGEERAVASNDSAEGRANNRRVEVVLPEGTLGIGGSGAPQDKHLEHQ